MFRLLIMFLLGLSGVFLKTSGAQASPMDTPLTDLKSMAIDAEGTALKLKRHHSHEGIPCPLPYSHSGSYLPPASPSGHYGPPAYQKPLTIPSYHQIPKVESIGYQKPMMPKLFYQTIQRPATHHAAYNIQPVVKQQVQYIQQPTYIPIVKEEPISYVKPMAPTISYENFHNSIDYHVKPIHENRPIQSVHPVNTFVQQIPYANHGHISGQVDFVKPIERPVMQMHSFYSKQFFQPISYYPKPLSQPKPISISPTYLKKYDYPSTKVIFQKPNLVEPCGETYQPQISYGKIPEPMVQNVHQPTFQYAHNYHQPIVQQPMVHFAQKVHHPPVLQQPLFHFAPKIHQPIVQKTVPQPLVYLNSQHSAGTVTPKVNYGGHNYQSPILSANQPCYK